MLRFILIFILVSGSASALCLFCFWRGLKAYRVLRLFVCALGLISSLSFPLLYKLSGASLIELFFLRLGALWIGLLFYTFSLSIITELCFYGMRFIPSLAHSRESIARWKAKAYLGLILLISIIGLMAHTNARHPVLREINIQLPSPTPGVAIPSISFGVLSDIHLGRLIDTAHLEHALTLLKPHAPDALFFVGDIIDDHLRVDAEAIKQLLKDFSPKLGSYGVLGNHEYIAGDIDHSIALINTMGIKILRDQWDILGGNILLLGRDDYSRPRFMDSERAPLSTILASIPSAQQKLPIIVLDHQPQVLRDAESIGAALQISGHTHNGQIWPINHLVKAIYENPYGHVLRGGTHSVVSLGLGTWGPPIRTTGAPEVLLIRLQFTP